MSTARFTVTLELFFKHVLLDDKDAFIKAFMGNGFSILNEEQGILSKGRFTIRLSRFTRVKGKAINTAAIGISKDELRSFINHITTVKLILANMLNKSIEDDVEACSLLINSWVNDGNDAGKVIASVKSLDGMDEFSGYIVHRNPFGKLEFVSKESDLDAPWSKIEIDSTDESEYLISLHYYTSSIEEIIKHIECSYDRVMNIVKVLEARAA